MVSFAVLLYFSVPSILTLSFIIISDVSMLMLPFIVVPFSIITFAALMLMFLSKLPFNVMVSAARNMSLPILAFLVNVIVCPAAYMFFVMLPFIVMFCPAMKPYSRFPFMFIVCPAMNPIPSMFPAISMMFPAIALSPFTVSCSFTLSFDVA